jgi:hypothetical protein
MSVLNFTTWSDVMCWFTSVTMIDFIWSACILLSCIRIFDMFYILWPVGQFGFMESENKYQIYQKKGRMNDYMP